MRVRRPSGYHRQQYNRCVVAARTHVLTPAVEAVAAGTSDDPFAVLGCHSAQIDGRPAAVVRTMQPFASSVAVIAGDGVHPMRRVHAAGIFEVVLEVGERWSPERDYRLQIDEAGHTRAIGDPYRFGPVLGDLDLHLFCECTYYRSWDSLGARTVERDGVAGVHFAVWAPNAQRVSVVGDFNRWDGRTHPMRRLGSSGLWEHFIPGLTHGALYKFEVRTRDGALLKKSDPYAQCCELPPRTASVVWSSTYEWRDDDWMEARARSDGWFTRPMSVYEVHPGSWRRMPEEGNRWLTYRELAEQLVPYVSEMGFTHIELMPIMEHPFSGSWGYQVTGFFAPTSRFGTPDDFRYLVDTCHQHGIGVLLDWVPGHFPRDAHGLARFDGTALYEHSDPRQGEHREWGTLIFNYGRHEVRTFLVSSALYWLQEFHIDGLRVDAVASMLYLDYSRPSGSWVPNQYGGRENLEAVSFIQQLNTETHGLAPGTITLAEESTAWPSVSRPVEAGGLGFTYKWNMGWMHDVLAYLAHEPIHRRWHHGELTCSLLYAFTENFVLPLSHDEVVHGKGSLLDKMPGDVWQKHATLRALYGFMFGHPGKKLLFMGGEFGQLWEWHHDRSLDWHVLSEPLHAGLQRWVRDLNGLYRREPSLHQVDFDPSGFEWIDCSDDTNSALTWMRRASAGHDSMIVAVNFTPVPRQGYRIGVPQRGRFDELLNSDSHTYGGSDIGNAGAVVTEDVPSHGHAQSLVLTLPPLGCVFVKHRPD